MGKDPIEELEATKINIYFPIIDSMITWRFTQNTYFPPLCL